MQTGVLLTFCFKYVIILVSVLKEKVVNKIIAFIIVAVIAVVLCALSLIGLPVWLVVIVGAVLSIIGLVVFDVLTSNPHR